MATPLAAQDQVDDRDVIVVNRQKAADAKVESPKATSALRDTPQTITVLNDQTIRKQNLQTLRDALQTIPGVTFGEGGGGYGDSINLRGYSAANDITVDGVRDSAQYSRTDPFNLRQIEVCNGANTVFNGSGSVGGTINLVSKVPGIEDLSIVQASVDTNDCYCAPIDANKRVSDLVAVRLTGACHHNYVPGRDVEKFERWGTAPSMTIGIVVPTSLTLAYVHQEDRSTPLYGVPYFQSPIGGGVLPGVDRSDYYGIANLDRQDQTVDRFTATFRHHTDDRLSVRNLTRWQRVAQGSVTSAPQGTYCLSTTGLQPVGANAAATVGIACPAGLARGCWRSSGPRGLVRDQVNDLLYDQIDLRHEAGEKGRVRNIANIGVSGTIENYRITSGSLLRTAAGVAVTPPDLTISNPDTWWTAPVNLTVTSRARAETQNLAVYAFDTLELDRYFELNGGVRWEVQDATFRDLPLAVAPPGTTPVLYPASSLHRVTPVTRGLRTAAFFWLQSVVRDDGERRLLFDLDQSVQALGGERGQGDTAVMQLAGLYHNLLRRWAGA